MLGRRTFQMLLKPKNFSARTLGTAKPPNSDSGNLNMTKVVCTLGPSTEAAGPVNKLVTEGMSVARLNFSHVMDYSEPLAKLELVREAHGTHGKMGWAGAPPNLRAVMVDTKGLTCVKLEPLCCTLSDHRFRLYSLWL